MTRKQKLLYNTSASLLYQFITLICGFILPRFFLYYYGSEVNGLISSITQFLGFISLAECGVGAVVQSTLYKPLVEKNYDEISRIIISSDRFFHRIAFILILYTFILILFYPIVTIKSFDYAFTASLILVISISSFAQYYFGMSYKLLLNADQVAFIQLSLQSFVLILNTILSVILINFGSPVQLVKLVTSLLFLLQPFVLSIYVKKHYKLNKKLVLYEEPIRQKWNGLAQHIASVVLGNTDTVVLTLFSTLQNVSIYAIYYMVVNGIKQIIVSFTAGMQSMLGNMLVKNESILLCETFSSLEWFLHTITVFLFTCTGILALPFVSVYTNGITDTNYQVPFFSVLITFAQAIYCLRLPYNMMVLAAGHYRQTQFSAILEATINIVLSIVLVIKFGLIGVAIGTVIAMSYRTLYLVLYLSKSILFRKIKYFYKHIFTDILIVILTVFFTHWFSLSNETYLGWIILSAKVAIICLAVVVIINYIFYKDFLLSTVKRIFSKKY